MGKRNNKQHKNADMLDSYDDTSCVSSSATLPSGRVSVSGDDRVLIESETSLDQALDALYEKRGSTRETALSAIINAFSFELQHEFVELNFATLLHRCLNSIKKGSSKEISLASHTIGLLALTVGCGNNAHEIFEESIVPLSQALKSGFESSKFASLVDCLAITTFVGGNEPEETKRAMHILWQVIHPKLGPSVVAIKTSGAVAARVVSAWTLLLSTMDGWALNASEWQESLSYLSGLLDDNDRSVRIAAGEALALAFETVSLDKLSAEAKGSTDVLNQEGSKSLAYIQGLREKILSKVHDLSVEAGGKGSAKKDLNIQRSKFRDILEFMEAGCSPKTSMKIGGVSLQTSTWSQLIQLNFLKHLLRGGFLKHMQDNELLHDIFGFTPKQQYAGIKTHMCGTDKRMYKSPNSVVCKARTRYLNKQRALSKDRKVGRFSVNTPDEI